MYSILLILATLCTLCAYRHLGRHGGIKMRHRQHKLMLKAEPENVYTGVPGVASYEDVTFGIMGGGAFSLALAKVLSYKNIKSRLLVRDPEVAEQINENRYHPKFVS